MDFKAIELKKGSVYAVEHDQILSRIQRDQIREYFKFAAEKYGVEFVILPEGFRISFKQPYFIHTPPGDGRGEREFFMEGKKIERVVYANERTGELQFYTSKDTLEISEIVGNLEVKFVRRSGDGYDR